MKNKILLISIIFILLFSVLTTTIYAAEINFGVTDINGVYHSLSTLPSGEPVTYVYCLNDGNWDSLLVSYTEGSYFKITGIGQTYNVRCFNSNNEEISFMYKGKSSSSSYWQVSETVSVQYLTITSIDNGHCAGTLYNEDDTLFFRQPPGTTLAEVLEEAKPTLTFQTMMSGIIPYLIALVVGLVAFWKAWQLLLKELLKA